MAALFDAVCDECGEQHEFYFPDADAFPTGTVFEYVCPITQNTTRVISPDDWNKVGGQCPESVIIHRV